MIFLCIHFIALLSSFGTSYIYRVYGNKNTQCCSPLPLWLWLKGLVHLMRLQHCDSQTLTGGQVLVEPVQHCKHFSQSRIETAHRPRYVGSCCHIHFLHLNNCIFNVWGGGGGDLSMCVTNWSMYRHWQVVLMWHWPTVYDKVAARMESN